MSQAETVQRRTMLLVRLGELGIAQPQQLEQARLEQAKHHERFGSVLVRLGILRDADAGKRLAAQLGWMPRRLDPLQAESGLTQRIPLELCRTHRIAPIRQEDGGRIMVATDDPLTSFAVEYLEQRCNAVGLDVVLVREPEFDTLMTQLVQSPPSASPAAAGRTPTIRSATPTPAPSSAPPVAPSPAAPPKPATSPPPPPPLEPRVSGATPHQSNRPAAPGTGALLGAPPAPASAPVIAQAQAIANPPPVAPTSPVQKPVASPPPPPAASPKPTVAPAPPPPPPPSTGPSTPVRVIKITPVAAPTPPAPPAAAQAVPPTPSKPAQRPAPIARPAPPRPAPSAPRAPIVSAATASVAAEAAAAGGSDEPIIRLVDSMLAEAVRLRASDVHIEALAESVRVRYRIDGVLHDVNSPSKALHGPIVSRLKIMAGLNIAERRLPQDGRLQIQVAAQPLDVRVSILPALHGESVVMRLLVRSDSVKGVHDIGLPEREQAQWVDLITRPYGMVLVTGPTGSGKSTTLYATLAFLNRPDRKLITVEDPVEYRLAGVNQVNVKSAIGLTFAAGLRAMLRQAPDVIMVGEIRDQETAQIAIQAALTGHLVFSTLHTNDAVAAVTRLIDMGVAPFLVASTVQGVLAQRLVRRVCATCQTRRAPTPEEAAFLGEPAPAEIVIGAGCDTCHGSGYYGRIGIYELLVLTDGLRRQIVKKVPASALRRFAVGEGMLTLRQDGCRKILEGLTTIDEVLRATPSEAE